MRKVGKEQNILFLEEGLNEMHSHVDVHVGWNKGFNYFFWIRGTDFFKYK